MFFIETAYAMGQAGQAGSGDGMGGMASLLPIVMIFAIIYFLIIRPQQKRDQQHKAMLKALKPGDRVMTAGGIYGTLLEVNDDTVLMDLGNKVVITVARQSVGTLMPKGKVSKEERRTRRERKGAAPAASEAEQASAEPKEEFEGKSFDAGFDGDTEQKAEEPKDNAADNDAAREDQERK